MSEFPHSGSGENLPGFAIGHVENVTYMADGVARVDAIVDTYNMGPEELRELVADGRGVDPDSISIDSVDGVPYDKPRGRNTSRAAFSSKHWNSSWNPNADPNMN